MYKLRYITIIYFNLRNYSKVKYFEYKAYKSEKQRSHLLRKFPNKYGVFKGKIE